MKCSAMVLIALLTAVASFAQQTEDEVLDYLKTTLDFALSNKDKMIEDWKQQYTDSQENDNVLELIGYRPPDFLVSVAAISSHLYEKTQEKKYAEITKDIIVSLESYRDFFPDRLKDRVEYKSGIPVVNWFRTLPKYIESYHRTEPSGLYSRADIQKIEESVAASVDIIFAFPEWGAMNRAMLRAESLMAAAVAFPNHKDIKKWKKMAEILASDSLEKWEIEDAQIYHPVWLRPYVNYLDLTGQTEVFQSPVMKFYFDYFVSLITPNRTIPEFGDGVWKVGLDEYYLMLERGAKEYQSGEMKWAANEIFANMSGLSENSVYKIDGKSRFEEPNIGFANVLVARDKYMDDNVKPVEPHYGSGDALEEIVSKKIVFRSDWSKDATYLMLNYKDEGYYSLMQKNYLKHVLAVEEEKMHHGHSDENSICLLMKNGAILLSDGNYREIAPSGDFGAFRADIFHNRVVVRNVKKSLNQPYFDILRNSGAYNDQVRTTKMDFQSFKEIEYSRTRLEDFKYEYRWDRILTRHKTDDYFIMVDALKFFKSDYYTVANLLHTRKIIDQGDNWFVTRIDQLMGEIPISGDLDLLVIFPQNKCTATEEEWRDKQDELALFQGVSQYYDAGKVESFVTVLYPIKRGDNPAQYVKRFRLIRNDMKGVGIEVKTEKDHNIYGFKLDLDMDLLKEDVRPRYNYDSGKLTYGDVETDADIFFLEIKNNKPFFSAT
ncbi:hypothetical protein GWO43_23010, partial [candidate division KSB1 bacterium]|nr:hypothetical protein [candidate division KSB1 bacterium]NIV70776.1 hypothetical protein [Phycisphaerae bacterium]NIR72895.1 hypothetical protein [candidate division KSB1 bacterium]NIT73693.1 hypothetical protein [candidate division KSB1 bacterium]NIU27565.1 hypothetical protein [candidate division KSB1 bacterium]